MWKSNPHLAYVMETNLVVDAIDLSGWADCLFVAHLITTTVIFVCQLTINVDNKHRGGASIAPTTSLFKISPGATPNLAKKLQVLMGWFSLFYLKMLFLSGSTFGSAWFAERETLRIHKGVDIKLLSWCLRGFNFFQKGFDKMVSAQSTKNSPKSQNWCQIREFHWPASIIWRQAYLMPWCLI